MQLEISVIYTDLYVILTDISVISVIHRDHSIIYRNISVVYREMHQPHALYMCYCSSVLSFKIMKFSFLLNILNIRIKMREIKYIKNLLLLFKYFH